MPVYEVIRSADGHGSSAKGTSPNKVTYTYKETIKVRCDRTDGARVIYDHFQSTSDLPWFGRRYKVNDIVDERVQCNSFTPDRDPKGDGWWSISVEYAPNTSSGEEEKPEDNNQSRPNKDGVLTKNPLDWAWEIRMDETSITIPVEQAKFIKAHGVAIGGANSFFTLKENTTGAVVNSAGVPFDPPPEEELKIRIFSVTKYSQYYDGDEDNAWKNAVNTDTVTILWASYRLRDQWKPYTAKVSKFSSNFVWVNGMGLWRATLEIHVNPLGWRWKLLDRGTERGAGYGDPDGKGGTLKESDIKPGMALTAPIRDRDGYPVAAPVLLNGKGQPLNPGEPHVFLEYARLNEKALSPLLASLGPT